MKSENSKIFDPHTSVLKTANKIDLKRIDQLLPYQSLVSTTPGKKYKNNEFRISVPTWNDKSDGSYSLSDIHGYSDYIIKKHEVLNYNLTVRIYINRIEKRITFLKLRLRITSTFNC